MQTGRSPGWSRLRQSVSAGGCGDRQAERASSSRVTSFRILGPVEVWRDQRRLPLGGPRPVKLLSVLLLHANRAVSTDVLTDVVWGAARDGADNRLQMAIARLRKALEPLHDAAEPVLRTVSGGYMLSVAAGDLDADVFQSRIQEGQRALEARQPETAAALLREAMALWRGPPLAEVAFEDFAQGEIRRLHELRLVALEGRIDAELALGHHAALVAELEALMAEEPTRERIAGQLMLALYRSGRQADALAVFQRTRTGLAQELGIEPGTALKALQRQILDQDPALEPPQTVAGPGVNGATGIGGLPPHNLPAVYTSFVGRTDEVTRIDHHLETARVVTLIGVGGVGKTRLALEVAQRGLRHWPDGVWFVELGAISDRAGVAEAVAAALDLEVSDERGPTEAIVQRVEERRLLLVLDNCEHLLEACAALAARIAQSSSGSCVLATSRARLALAGEQAIHLRPLPVPDGEVGTAELADVDAIRLFLERAARARLGFAPSGQELDAIAQLCRTLDGLPLAIELAASRVRAMAPSEILARLRDRLTLAGGERDRVARHRDLESTIRWSYDLLDEEQRRLFRRVAVFPAPFTLSAAESLVGDGDVAEAIVGLVDSSILEATGHSSPTRYRMLETLRDFGLRRLVETGEEADVRQSLLVWALDFVADAAAAAETDQRTAALAEVVAERRNLMAGLTGAGEPGQRIRLASGLAGLLSGGTSLREMRRMLEDVLGPEADTNSPEVRGARLMLGRSLRKLGDLDVARIHLTATGTLAEAAGDRATAAIVAAECALIEIRCNRYEHAQRLLDSSYRPDEHLDHHVWTHRLNVEAQLRWALDELEAAGELYETCIARARRHGPTADLINALAALAELAVELDDSETAERCAREVLAITDPVADAYSRGGAILALGLAALRAGRAGEATRWLAEGAALDIQRGSVETPITLESLAHAVAQTGHHADSARILGAATALRRRVGVEPMRDEQVTIDAALKTIHEQLGDGDVERYLADGHRLSERELLGVVTGASREAPVR